MTRHIGRSLLALSAPARRSSAGPGSAGAGAVPRAGDRSSSCRRPASSTTCMAGYLADGIARGRARDGAAAVVIKLNTPGGT